MTSILTIDKPLVTNDLWTYYQYNAEDIQEVHGGTVGYTYCIDKKFFLKLYDTQLVITQRCTESLFEQLTILDYLQKNTPLTDKICYPIKTKDNGYFFSHDHVIGVLFNFIKGTAIGFESEYTTDQISQLTAIVRDLHKMNVCMFEEYCTKEDFNPRFVDSLALLIREDIETLPQNFYEAIAGFAEAIHGKIAELKELAQELKQMNLPFVLCHTDIHGGNIMSNAQGQIFLVDWENMILAPKEADLFAFWEKEYFGQFSDNVNERALLFYSIRRDLEDIWEFCSSVLHNEYDEAEKVSVISHVRRILTHLSQTK